jgi:small nuclear ribonucleoprotein (snRNP)-like protein
MEEKKYIGASQCGALLGMVGSRRQTWEQIMGIGEDIDSEAMQMGRLLEDDVLALYSDRHCVQLQDFQKQKFEDIYRATIDAYDPVNNCIVEAKTHFKAVETLPQYYLAQVLCQMYVHNVPRAVVAYIAGMRYSEFVVEAKDFEYQWNIWDKRLHEFYEKYIAGGQECPPDQPQEIPPGFLVQKSEKISEEDIWKVNRLYSLKRQKAEIEGRLKAIEEEYNALLLDLVEHYNRPTELLLPDGSPFARCETRRVRGVFDTKRFKEEHEDLYKQYYREGGTKQYYTLLEESLCMSK